VAKGWRGIRISFLSDVRYLEAIRAVLREATSLVGFPPEQAAEVELAVTEGCANVIRHCYKNRPDKRIDLVLTFGRGEFEVLIDDYGTFVDPARIKSRDLDDVRPGGLGVHLMKRVMDEVRYEKNDRGGTSLTLRKRVAGAGREGGS
jgi:anti-sigma regulatory factor (Ser/Thr protein kinase)